MRTNSGGDEDSFFLYSVGEHPKALTLGSLVLEKYWQPLIARHYTHEPMDETDLNTFAWSSEIKNCVFHGKSRISPGFGLDGADIVKLELAFHKDIERLVIAKKGTRRILKDPEEFLREKVLTHPDAQSTLKLWLSAARSQYVLNLKWARRPKIWLLTGLYLLEDTRTMVNQADGVDTKVGVSSSLIGALSAVPLGGSVSLGVESAWKMTMEMEGTHVWAAQYRMIDARYISIRGKAQIGQPEAPTLPSSISLYKDILSANMRRGPGGAEEVQIALFNSQDTMRAAKEATERKSQYLNPYPSKIDTLTTIPGAHDSTPGLDLEADTELLPPRATTPRIESHFPQFEPVDPVDPNTEFDRDWDYVGISGNHRIARHDDIENGGGEEEEEEEEDYIDRLEMAIQTFEETPPRLLQ